MSLPERKSHRLRRIMRGGENVHDHLSQLQAAISFQAKPFHLLVLRSGTVFETMEGTFGSEERRPMLAGECQGCPGMVVVLVGDEESGDGARGNSESGQPPFNFPAGEPGIEEDIRRAVGDKCDVTATTAAQNGYL